MYSFSEELNPLKPLKPVCVIADYRHKHTIKNTLSKQNKSYESDMYYCYFALFRGNL